MQPGQQRDSIAVNAALRTGAGMIPSPTAMRSVAASAVAVWAIPPPLKQSSHSHASAKPAASAARDVRDEILRRELGADDDAEVHRDATMPPAGVERGLRPCYAVVAGHCAAAAACGIIRSA